MSAEMRGVPSGASSSENENKSKATDHSNDRKEQARSGPEKQTTPNKRRRNNRKNHSKQNSSQHNDTQGAGHAAKSQQTDGADGSSNNTGNDQKPRPNQHKKPQKKNHASRSQHRRNEQQSMRQRAVYSAIDLGTNNCRLLIAKPTHNGFRIIDAFSRVVRLGEGIASSGELSQGAMDRTVEALKVCAEKIKRRGVTTMHHVATEACRIATNTHGFLERVRKETGINLDVISTADEARLAVMGCQSLIAPSNKYALVFDIGGGSTELIWVKVNNGRGTEIIEWTSVPWGVVNLTESFSKPGADLSTEIYNAMVKEVKQHMHKFEDAAQISTVKNQRRIQFLGTSGTVTTLASLHMKLPRYDRSKVDGAWMKAKDIRDLSNTVAMMSYNERAAQPCIGEERADLVVAGCAILEAILGKWQVHSLRVADRGIREGILRGLMQTEPAPRQTWRHKNKNQNSEKVKG